MGEMRYEYSRPSIIRGQDDQGGSSSLNENQLQSVASEALQLSHHSREPPLSPVMSPIAPATPETFNLHIDIEPEGDRTVTNAEGDGVYTYRVCSQPLILASPVFRQIAETQVRAAEYAVVPPVMRVPDTNFRPWAMEQMLHALHYHPLEGFDKINPLRLAEFALHCATYSCAESLGPWACGWAYQCKIRTGRDVGYLLLAGAVMKSDVIQMMAKRKYYLVNPAEMEAWKDDEVLSQLPPLKHEELMLCVFLELKRIIHTVHDIVTKMKESNDRNHIYYICDHCGIVEDHYVVDCNATFTYKFCGRDARVAEILEVLTSSGALCNDEHEADFSPQEMVKKLLDAVRKQNYECPHFLTCSYYQELSRIAQALRAIRPMI